jgi:adenylate kinase
MSGSGKGTQIELLSEYLERKDINTPVFHLQLGQYFRDFISRDTYAANIAKKMVEGGNRGPDFLAMWMWSNVMVKNLTGKEHLVIDGSPRSLNEAQNLDIALKFFKRDQPAVVHIKVSPEWSEQHLMERAKKEGRADDNKEGIKRRIGWYQRDVLPAVEFYRRDRDYDFIEVNGEQPIELVHREIIVNLFGE